MDYIEKNRKLKNLSVNELTQKINVSRSVYYQWLRGEKKPRIENIYKMCEVLEIEFNIKDFI